LAHRAGWLMGVKRTIDLAVAAIGLLVTLPATAAIALAIALDMGSPVLFRQARPGLAEKPFVVLKFRTMSNGDGPDRDRMTTLGRFLRSSSLDEIPQLINVLRGDMSLVGPRPLLMRYLPYFTDAERRRFDMRPGIAGWAQVNGRNELAWDDRLALDVWYVDHWSLRLDVSIVLKTVRAVFNRRGFTVNPELLMADLDVERASKGLESGDA
jgi:lipopolysaccharide/colanic/teichoic acid biosynthesis glycosyltransferase